RTSGNNKECVEIPHPPPKQPRKPTLPPQKQKKLVDPPSGDPLQPSSSFSSLSDPVENARHKAFKANLNKMVEFVSKDDVYEENAHGLRKARNLAPNQKSPFVGSSAVKRIVFGVFAGEGQYDPFQEVERSKYSALLDFITPELDNAVGDTDPIIEFFLQLMTAKANWPILEYGWLGDRHMTAGMHMFRQRYLRDLCPFQRDGRVAFLDPLFTGQWLVEFQRDFLPNPDNWAFRSGYIDVAYGRSPDFAVSNKIWFKDVDLLYICHNIGSKHWIAVEVHLPRKRVHIYDCISTAYPDRKLKQEVRAYARMIPLLLCQLFPGEWTHDQTFHTFIMKNVPQNVQTGDCGVFTFEDYRMFGSWMSPWILLMMRQLQGFD
ncbi:hypothetical protein EUTSA_v10001219mg, partial [Eutrema salsugineum]